MKRERDVSMLRSKPNEDDRSVIMLCDKSLMRAWSQQSAKMPSSYYGYDEVLRLQQRCAALPTQRELHETITRLPAGLLQAETLHALVPNRMQVRTGKLITYHCYSKPLPPGSLVEAPAALCDLSCCVLLPSPEFLFVQFAANATMLETIDFGNELCGRYAVDWQDSDNLIDREPVTSVARLEHYLENADGIHGVKRAKRAIKYIVPNAKSPWESRFIMLMHLPLRDYGGLGISEILVNQEMSLYGEARKMFRNDSCEPDFQFPKTGGIIELDGDSCHLEADRVRVDRRKSNALTLSGKKVLRVDVDQLRDFQQCMNTCASIRALAGMSVQVLNDEQLALRGRLHSYLLHGMSQKR